MNELATITVPGTDNSVMAALVGGEPFAALKPMCDAFGIDPWTQQRKLNGKSWATTSKMTVVAADGKPREMYMVDRRTLTMWLATLDESRVAEEYRPTLVAFQAQAADALDAYFHEGGAINPNATEDQLDRLARTAQAQAAVIAALKGIVDDKHLEAKGRVVLARALGEAPEIAADDVPLYVSDYLKSKNLTRDEMTATLSGFGKRLRALYVVEYDREPVKHPQELPNGTIRQVNSYTESDRRLFDQVWERHYAQDLGA